MELSGAQRLFIKRFPKEGNLIFKDSKDSTPGSRTDAALLWKGFKAALIETNQLE